MVHYACCFCLVSSLKLDFRVHLEKNSGQGCAEMEEKQTRKTLLARIRVWKWPLAQGGETTAHFSLTDTTSLCSVSRCTCWSARLD